MSAKKSGRNTQLITVREVSSKSSKSSAPSEEKPESSILSIIPTIPISNQSQPSVPNVSTQTDQSTNGTVHTAEQRIKLGTGETYTYYDTGKVERSGINPVAEMVRQGGRVETSRGAGGRPQITEITPAPDWEPVRNQTGQTIGYQGSYNEVQSIREPQSPASQWRADTGERTTFWERVNRDATMPAYKFFYRELGDLSGKMSRKSIEYEKKGNDAFSFALNAGRAPVEGLRWVFEDTEIMGRTVPGPTKSAAIVGVAFGLSAGPELVGGAFPEIAGSVKEAVSGVGAIGTALFVSGKAKEFSESGDIPKTIGKTAAETGLVGIGFISGQPSVKTEETVSFGKQKGIRIGSDTKINDALQINYQVKQESTYFNRDLTAKGIESQEAVQNPFSPSTQNVNDINFQFEGTATHQPKGAAKLLRGAASTIFGKERIPDVITSTQVWTGQGGGAFNVNGDIVSGRESGTRTLTTTTGRKSVVTKSDWLTDVLYSAKQNKFGLMEFNGVIATPEGSLSSFRTSEVSKVTRKIPVVESKREINGKLNIDIGEKTIWRSALRGASVGEIHPRLGFVPEPSRTQIELETGIMQKPSDIKHTPLSKIWETKPTQSNSELINKRASNQGTILQNTRSDTKKITTGLASQAAIAATVEMQRTEPVLFPFRLEQERTQRSQSRMKTDLVIQRQGAIFKQGLPVEEQGAIFKESIVEKQATVSKQSTVSRQLVTQNNIFSNNVFTSMNAPIAGIGGGGFALPSLKIPGAGAKSDWAKNQKKSKPKPQYNPTLRSSIFSISGKAPKGMLTGLEERPIPKLRGIFSW